MRLQKQQEELELTRRFFVLFGHPDAKLEAVDCPDVIAIVDGHRIGIEVTQFHSDEQSGTSGSPLRAEEAQKVIQAEGRPYSMSGKANPLTGIVARIQDKVERATKYDSSRYSELWLLISSQVPGAVASTFISPSLVDIPKLNETTHKLLTMSPFVAVYLHLVMTHNLFSWSRENQWYANQVGNS